jgi:hypothetical protein
VAVVAGVALLGLGVWEVHRLSAEVAELRDAVAAQRTAVATNDCSAKDDDNDNDADEDSADVDVEADESADVYTLAQDAYVHGQYTTAMALADRLTDEQPAKAYRIKGASACFLKDRANAKAAYKELDATGREFLKYVCARNSVALP